jgi:hypothetical protein
MFTLGPGGAKRSFLREQSDVSQGVLGSPSDFWVGPCSLKGGHYDLLVDPSVDTCDVPQAGGGEASYLCIMV